MPDAPDYTLLSDVNVVGSVTLNVNVTNATLNVNITNPVLLTGQNKPALAFDGIDDLVVIPYSDVLNITDNITVLVRFMTFNAAENQKIVSKYPGVPQWMLGIYDSRAYPELWTESGTSHSALIGTIQSNRWHHYGFSYRSSDGYYSVYIDGVKVGIIPTDGLPMSSSPGETVIGAVTTAGGFNLYGMISEVMIYNQVLTDDEIRWNYENPHAPITRGLVLWMKFDEGTGTTAHDSSGYNNHGTIVGARWVSSEGTAPSLMNVNITGQAVKLDVNIASQTAALDIRIVESLTTLNVNIASQTVTINTNIEAQTVDLRIFTPSGRWVSASDLMTTSVTALGVTAGLGQEGAAILVTGRRGRLKFVGIRVHEHSTHHDVRGLAIRIYVDGNLAASFDWGGLNLLMGGLMDQIIAAGQHHVNSGLSWPFFVSRLEVRTIGELYLIISPYPGPKGGVTYVMWDTYENTIVGFGAYLNVDFEFTNSLLVTLYNSSVSPNVAADIMAIIGEYL